MRRNKKSRALQARDELMKISSVSSSNGSAAQPASLANGFPAMKPNQEVVQTKSSGGLGSFVAATEKKVVSEMPPMTFEETFRGKQDTLIGILRILVYENEFTEMVRKGQMNQATFDQLKAGALQAYKMWPKEIYAAMLQYQKSRSVVNGSK